MSDESVIGEDEWAALQEMVEPTAALLFTPAQRAALALHGFELTAIRQYDGRSIDSKGWVGLRVSYGGQMEAFTCVPPHALTERKWKPFFMSKRLNPYTQMFESRLTSAELVAMLMEDV